MSVPDPFHVDPPDEMACWAPDHTDADPPMTWSDVGHIAVAIACAIAAAFVCWVMPMGPAQ